MGEKKVGVVSKYFHKIGVAAVLLEDTLTTGSKIKITGSTTDLEMTVDSMQMDRKEIESGSKGQEIAIKVPDRVREKDSVYLVDTC